MAKKSRLHIQSKRLQPYERLFETGNLTNEMIKNERQLISLKEVLQKFVQMKND